MFFPPENSLIRVSIALESTRRTKTRHGPGSTQHSCRPGRPKTPLNTQRGTVSAVSDPCLVACPHLPRTTALLPDEQPHLNLFPRPLVSAGLPGAPQQRHRDVPVICTKATYDIFQCVLSLLAVLYRPRTSCRGPRTYITAPATVLPLATLLGRAP